MGGTPLCPVSIHDALAGGQLRLSDGARPLAAVLLLRRRWAGLALGCTKLLTDATANGYANYVLDDIAGLTVGRVGHGVISALALSLTLAATQLWSVPRPGSTDG